MSAPETQIAGIPAQSPPVGSSTQKTTPEVKSELVSEANPETPVTGVTEPQSALTQKFTEAEWKALKEFRQQLPTLFASAYDDKPNARTRVINLWGVKINPSDPINPKVSVVLMKFLRARNLSVRDAGDMFVATLRWREQFNVEAACKEEFPKDLFENLGHIHGHDKEGHPVVYNIYGGNKDVAAVFKDVQMFLRWRVAFMEKSLALLDFENVDQALQIHDYEGVSITSRDANSKQAASEASSIFGDHYPELLYKKFFVNVPSYLTWIFWLFKPIIPAATLAKMSVVRTGPRTIGKTLLPIIDAKQLPKRYGGESNAF